MVKVKICGITNLEDALIAVNAGCDALGFNFYHKSPRYITPEEARAIIKKLPKSIIKIGVFVNAREKTVKQIADYCGLNIVQFHGHESVKYCNKFKGYRIIKVFHIKNKIDIAKICTYRTFAYLFDTYLPGRAGGTGKSFNWHLARHLKGMTRPVFLSGGLTKENVSKAIRYVNPDWVDVCSSIELFPGKKDEKELLEFVRAAKKQGS